MIIKPLFDRVLITPVKGKKSSLIIPDSTQGEKMQVIALGENTNTVKPNDVVLINRYAGSEFKLDGETFILIKETDILGVIEGEQYE